MSAFFSKNGYNSRLKGKSSTGNEDFRTGGDYCVRYVCFSLLSANFCIIRLRKFLCLIRSFNYLRLNISWQLELNNHTSDHDLVESLQRGDPEAFDLIFKRYGGRLYGFVFKYLKSKEESEELVQDVFLKIWENRKNLKQEAR